MSTVLVAMRARLDSADRLVGAILDSTVGTADLAATGKAPTMRLYWNRARGLVVLAAFDLPPAPSGDRKSTRLNSSHGYISYAVFCLKKKKIPSAYMHRDICRLAVVSRPGTPEPTSPRR